MIYFWHTASKARNVMSARFIAQGALVEWSQLQLFKATSGKIKTCQRPANGAIYVYPKIWHQIFDIRCQLTTISTNRAICTNSNYLANAN
jgi:hypothetical protein